MILIQPSFSPGSLVSILTLVSYLSTSFFVIAGVGPFYTLSLPASVVLRKWWPQKMIIFISLACLVLFLFPVNLSMIAASPKAIAEQLLPVIVILLFGGLTYLGMQHEIQPRSFRIRSCNCSKTNLPELVVSEMVKQGWKNWRIRSLSRRGSAAFLTPRRSFMTSFDTLGVVLEWQGKVPVDEATVYVLSLSMGTARDIGRLKHLVGMGEESVRNLMGRIEGLTVRC